MRKGYGSGVWIKGMDHAVPQGMDQGMDRGVWIVCGFGALIHTLYFDSYPVINYVNCTSCYMFNSMENPTVDTHHVRYILLIVLPIVSHTSTMYPVCSLEVQTHVSSVQDPLSLYHHLLSFFTGWLIEGFSIYWTCHNPQWTRYID